VLPARVLVLGRGRLGGSLQAALQTAGIAVEVESARATREDRPGRLIDHDLVILAVPDGTLAELALALRGSALAAAGAVVHLSGALDLEPLRPLREDGHAVGSLHPLRPFPTALPASAFFDATIAIDASDAALLATLSALAHAIGARPKLVAAGERAAYHAAAVVASSYVVVLAEQAVRLLGTIGWAADEALASLLPLLRGTVENLAVEGLPNALTGPLRRGDAETIAAHLRAIGTDPELAATLQMYRQLGLAGLAMAQQLGLSDLDAARISDELRRLQPT
jgi:predicted short-subunit dehydrogenase-like oxidoreductase (DUF2520 family)